ncbi:hypothetical protein [Nitrosomonas oligotropha]|uniref:hypothetical protein n=1 Tax=Nitrosomonas oligotropha TaxID=42354 RepID=UPI000895074F|nr:hypothetical protein [Nitrosomonas oligotropha]SDX40246.1 hypothetical protein SAMN05216300_1341 [Nitrosomonas oligotropha]
MVVKSIYYKGKRVVSFCGLNKTYLLRIREFIQPTGNRRIALRLLMAASAYPISLVERFFGARDYFFEEALEELYRGLNEKPVALFAIWAQDDSKFRASVYYYTKERIRFCKIGFSEQDLEDFQNELTISRYLAAYGKWGFYIPSNIDGFFGRSVSILSFDCLPPRLTIWRGLPVSKRNLLLIQLQSLTGVQEL